MFMWSGSLTNHTFWYRYRVSNVGAASYFQAKFWGPQEIFPVPFRWIYYIAKAVYKSKGSKHTCPRDHMKYYSLLRRLVLEHREEQVDSSRNRQNDDLRMDILNELKTMKT